MDAELLKFRVRSFDRWLDEWKPGYRDLSRLCVLLRQGQENTGERDAMREARSVADFLIEYDPERFSKIVERFRRYIRLEDRDAERLASFGRREQPRAGDSTRERLEWFEEFQAVLRIALEYFEYAQLEAMSDLEAMDDTMGPDGTQLTNVEGGQLGQDDRPGQVGTSSNYLGLVVDEGRRIVRRDGYPGHVGFALKPLALRWNVFLRLLKSRARGCRLDDLRRDWVALGGSEHNPSDSAFWDVKYRLRVQFEPLGLTCTHRDGRYFLEEIDSDRQVL
jgi:hypothetical protein